jgi:hypothetical protein
MNEDERLRVWEQVQARAERLLEHPRDLEPRDVLRPYSSLWRLWHSPPYGPQTTWTVLLPGRKLHPGSPARVREVTWDRNAEHERLFGGSGEVTAAPAVRVRDAYLPMDALQELVLEGARLAVPLLAFVRGPMLDEELFGLETYEVSPFVHVQWWGGGPPGWRHFTEWVARLRGFLLLHLDEAGES